MSKKPLKENEFTGAPAGMGSIASAPGWGTHSSPDVSQDPSKFGHGGGAKNILPAKGPQAQSGSAELARDVDKLMAKPNVPTVDDVACGLDYELSQMVVKEKNLAKQRVIANLKKNPHYYSDLDQLNINMDKTPEEIKKDQQMAERKNIFKDMIENHNGFRPKREVTPELEEVMKQMWEDKQKRRSWMG